MVTASQHAGAFVYDGTRAASPQKLSRETEIPHARDAAFTGWIRRCTMAVTESLHGRIARMKFRSALFSVVYN